MEFYHIEDDVVLECNDTDCEIDEIFHFDNFIDAFRYIGCNNSISFGKSSGTDIKVKKYSKKINRSSGMTEHYEDCRMIREQELTRLLGYGQTVEVFSVDDGRGKIQIQEVRDNGVIYVYDYETHNKITLFAPHPDRISQLFESVGELAPEKVITRSTENLELGYNELYNSDY